MQSASSECLPRCARSNCQCPRRSLTLRSADQRAPTRGHALHADAVARARNATLVRGRGANAPRHRAPDGCSLESLSAWSRNAFEHCVTVPPNVTGQDEAGRLWDVVWMLRFAILRSRTGAWRVPVALYVRNSDTERARLVKLIAQIGPLDIDDPSPSITVMLPEED
jgi:hypothetical protein